MTVHAGLDCGGRHRHRQRALPGRRRPPRARRRARWVPPAPASRSASSPTPSTRSRGGVASQPGLAATCPPSVTVLAGRHRPGTIDEGRAMAEIIYDEAPGITEMYFSTGTVSAAGKAASINNLVAAGVKVIADDIFYLDEPMFQDGAGRPGGRRRQGGRGHLPRLGRQPRQAELGGHAHTGATTTTSTRARRRHRSRRSGTFTDRIAVHRPCSGPSRGARPPRTWRSTGTSTASWSRPDRRPTTSRAAFPLEFEEISFAGHAHASVIGIRRVAGTGTPFMKYIVGRGPDASRSPSTRPTPTRSTPTRRPRPAHWPWPPADWTTPTTPEPFSSRGPTITRRFTPAGVPLAPVVRTKPALAAADGVSTTVPGLLDVLRHQRGHPERGGHRHAGPLCTTESHRRTRWPRS